MASTLYCRPSDIVTDSATVSLTSGTADSSYPLTNLYDRKAHSVFKSTGTGCTIQALFGGATTLQGLAIVNHKLAGATVTVTNAAGFSKGFTIPATPEDSLPLDPWDDYRGLANTSSTTWTITITGAATVVAIGELLLIQTLRTIKVFNILEDSEAHAADTLETDYGVRLKYGFGVRQRRLKVTVFRNFYRADVISLQRDARGAFKNFLFILDSTVNDALYVDLTTNERTIKRGPTAVALVDLNLTQQQNGLAL